MTPADYLHAALACDITAACVLLAAILTGGWS